MKKLAIYLIFLTASIQTVYAATYRVSSEEEFKAAIPKLLPGDEVVIADGNYTNWALTVAANGTADKPIVITAATNGKVIFSGDVQQTLFKFTGDYLVLKGIVFKGCTLLKAGGKTGQLIEFKDTRNCRLTNCVFTENVVKAQFMPLVIISGNGESNKIDSCSFISNVDNQDVQIKITKETCPLYSRIAFNLFKDKKKVSWQNGNGGECVQVGQDPVMLGTKEPKTIVISNRFIHCDGENEVISNKSSGNSYLKNYFEANDGELVMRGGHDCTISDNVFEGGTGGIRINGTGHTITNNKINGINTAIRLMYGMAKGKTEIGFYIAASDCTITGNQIANAARGILIGDSKNADWTGKFDTVKYPSPVMQNVAPFNNKISGNIFTDTKVKEVYQ